MSGRRYIQAREFIEARRRNLERARHMTPTGNLEFLEERRKRYPFEHVVSRDMFISPTAIKARFPEMQFVSVPLDDDQHWLFTSAYDLASFKEFTQT